MIDKTLKDLRVALITDSMVAYGGSDRFMFSILQLFPNATIFTSVFNKKKYNDIKYCVKTSFLQKIKIFQKHLNFLSPIAFEQFNLKGFDLVISLSAGSAKGVITNIYQPHIGIILTPPRNIWDGEMNTRYSVFKNLYRFISIFTTHLLRLWDINAVKRIDHILTISDFISRKIKKIYGLDSQVIYPGIRQESFKKPTKQEIEQVRKKYDLPVNFLFTLSRLYDHKRIDWNITSCIKNETYLCIAGDGPDLKYLKKLAKGSKYIRFLGHVNDFEARVIYSISDCFVFCSIEDFGIVTLESLAQGTPVIGLNEGGTSEIVLDGKSGKLISNITELNSAISQKVWTRYNPQDCIKRAHEFDEKIFHLKLTQFIKKIYAKQK